MPLAIDGLKECADCRTIYTVDQYTKDSGTSDGLLAVCRACRNARRKYGKKLGPYLPKGNIDGFKRCCTCFKIMPVSEFHVNTAQADGYEYSCRNCRRIARQNDESVRERGKAFYHRNKERLLAKNKLYREENKEKLNAQTRRWHEQHPGYGALTARQWRLANPERAAYHDRTTQNRRRASEAEQPHIPYTVNQIVERDGTKCALTAIDLDISDRSSFTVDHLQPIMVDMEWWDSVEPWAPRPGDQLGNVRLAAPGPNSGRGNRMTVLDHVELQCRMPCWFTRARIEQHYSNRS